MPNLLPTEPGVLTRTPTLVDLFAGCGGLSLGFEQAGFRPVFVSELNDDALTTYLNNRNHEIAGSKFSELKDLHINDAGDLEGSRIRKLKSDLTNLKELGVQFTSRSSTLDVVAGGPPCQGFSGIGHRRSFDVDKADLPSNLLYKKMAAIIAELRPRAFIFENVRGLLTSTWTRKGSRKIWPDVLCEFRSIPGYTVRWSLVSAKDYGVPQNRPRVLLIGLRDDILKSSTMAQPKADEEDAVACGFLPPPVRGRYPSLTELLGDLVDPKVDLALLSGRYPAKFETLTYPNPAQSLIQRELRTPRECEEPLPKGAPVTDHQYSKHTPLIVEKFLHMQDNDGEIPKHLQTKKFSQRVLPSVWGPDGPTITATSLPDDHVHFSQPRILTVREWARLQTFPDWYQFAGKRTTGGKRRAGNPQAGIHTREVPKYTQIGNAVPVRLAEAVGGHLRSVINEALS